METTFDTYALVLLVIIQVTSVGMGIALVLAGRTRKHDWTKDALEIESGLKSRKGK